MVTPDPNHYATLSVHRRASANEIKAAYRRLSRDLHPDRNTAADATQRMAALNVAYAVLSDPARRADHDRSLAKAEARASFSAFAQPPAGPSAFARARRADGARTVREYAHPPAGGRGAPQPDRLPDWYAFLGLEFAADPAEVLPAIASLRATILTANYTPEVENKLVAQLRDASETLTDRRVRDVYLDAMGGTPPAPGSYPQFHTNWYSFLGVRPNATLDRIAERVTALAASSGPGSREYQEITAAWKTLQDPAKRAEYDATLATAPGSRSQGNS